MWGLQKNDEVWAVEGEKLRKEKIEAAVRPLKYVYVCVCVPMYVNVCTEIQNFCFYLICV